ncbi:uncharacterized protein LOC126908095 isoform X1 [Daktulosphaira vitifoliae]|uniref:uncharacterized protein LOC126908095 isoform X1 n=1 Tax=Daktulosphaira vitifoliae TaxID=58002 RepID=UPI0021AA3237|nr:uncharacterized protein LOC126908095 isoform X1 [Daktulosphaira vitifoliae]
MLLLQFICLCLFLICIVEFSKAKTNYSIYKNALKNLFSYNGWTNLNDVVSVTFYGKDHTINESLEGTIAYKNFDNKVRFATLILGCSYVKDLKTFHFICESFRTHCQMLYDRKYPNLLVYDCTNKLIKLIYEINSLFGILQGALRALDTMHNYPSNEKSNTDFIYYHLFSTLQKKYDSLKTCFLSENNSENMLKHLFNYFNGNQSIIGHMNKHCNYIPYDLDVILKELNDEHKTITNKGETLYLFDYLSERLHDQIKHILVNKFIELGFKIDFPSQNMATSYATQFLYSAIINEELRVASENRRNPPLLIDFFAQGLNQAESSSQGVSEPMEVDSETSTPFKFI